MGHITEVVPGFNLMLKTDYAKFAAWAVEAGNAQVAMGNFGTQGEMADLITAAAARRDIVSPRARYRWNWPDPLFFIVAIVVAVDSVALAFTGPVGFHSL